jgi:predicted dinucleotide-binding enzyme
MKIGIIGAGQIGYNLAKKLALRHEIKLAGSQLSAELVDKAASIGVEAVDAKEAVKDVEVIILSLPFKAIAEIKDLFNEIPQDVVIADTGNYYSWRDESIKAIEEGMVETVWVSQQLGRPVIKAFNNILIETLIEEARPEGDLNRLAISVAGDSQHDKAIISGLINETGFDVVDAGDLSESWRQQPGSPAYCTELNHSELKAALDVAVKEKVPIDRDTIIEDFQRRDFDLSKEEKVKGCRSVHKEYFKTRGIIIS